TGWQRRKVAMPAGATECGEHVQERSCGLGTIPGAVGPVRAIIGYSEMLQEEADDLDADAFLPDLQRINAAGKHLLGLINDILDLSKSEAGKMDLYLETFGVPDLIRDVKSIVQPLIEKNWNSLVIECADAVGVM